jgi:hypothetical protein
LPHTQVEEGRSKVVALTRELQQEVEKAAAEVASARSAAEVSLMRFDDIGCRLLHRLLVSHAD